MELDTVIFNSNTAVVKGGAVYYDYKRPVFLNIQNTNNTAQYGPNVASYPVKIVENGQDDDQITLDNIGSDVPLESVLELKLVDYDGQTMVLNNINQILIQAVDEETSSVEGFNSAIFKSGVASFDSIRFVAKPGSTSVMFKASSKAISQTKIFEIFGSQLSDNEIQVGFRTCKPGEIQNTDNKCVT